MIPDLFRLLKVFFALPTDAKSFVYHKKTKGIRSLSEWLSFFETIVRFDALADDVRPRVDAFARFIILGTLALAILLLVFRVLPAYYQLYFLIIFLLVVASVVQLAARFFSRRDLDNNLRLFFIPALRHASELLGDKVKLEAHVTFHSPWSLTPLSTSKSAETKMAFWHVKCVNGTFHLPDQKCAINFFAEVDARKSVTDRGEEYELILDHELECIFEGENVNKIVPSPHLVVDHELLHDGRSRMSFRWKDTRKVREYYFPADIFVTSLNKLVKSVPSLS